ncbi:uncharacterized protein RCC_08881 [Ramularia collo-cygni]|uniref:Ankyrin repeat protein n=1 Tax=Ramularia collo-cygni TaxID=112498 RepID=A0A2D3VGA6_9PEZI|nr:uncharacterized protein RCC_08881 [Ramularia collo-cygni]CZT23171.1 uncharacterized protein RCC_08881 [Ramularia collo-cygni]
MKDLSFRDILPLKKASKQGQDVDSGDSHASSLATKSIPHNDAVPELRNVFTFGTRQSNYRDAASSVTSGNPFAAILDEKNSSGGRDSGAKSAVGTLSPSKQDAAMTSINHTAATSSQTAPPHFRVDQASVLNSGLTPNPKLFIDLQAQRVEESGPDVHASHARASGPFRATPIKIDFGKISQVFGQPTQDSEQESPGDPLADLVATTNALKLDDGEPQQDKSQPQEPVIQGQDPAVIQIDIGKREKYLNACRESDTSTLKQLFAEERQETIGYVDEEGNNGILLATQSSSDIETMHYLHEQGVSITHTNHISRTPLMEATRWGSLEQSSSGLLCKQPINPPTSIGR